MEEISQGDACCLICKEVSLIDEEEGCFPCYELASAYMASESW